MTTLGKLKNKDLITNLGVKTSCLTKDWQKQLATKLFQLVICVRRPSVILIITVKIKSATLCSSVALIVWKSAKGTVHGAVSRWTDFLSGLIRP